MAGQRRTSRFLVDTHIAIRWLSEPHKLSREQLRLLRTAAARGEPFALSAISLIEIALLLSDPTVELKIAAEELFGTFESETAFQILPISVAVATEVSAVGAALRDPADRTIVATARVHGLRLVTSDRRIIDSRLARVVE